MPKSRDIPDTDKDKRKAALKQETVLVTQPA